MYANNALQIDSTDADNIQTRSNVYWEMGNIQYALLDADKNIDLRPDNSYVYSCRAWIEEFIDSTYVDSAIEDYTTAITLSKEDNNYLYLRRGVCYQRIGNNGLAMKDLQKALVLPIQEKDTAQTLFAYAYMGETDKVNELLTAYKLTEEGKSDYYNIACIYALTNQKDSALHYLDLEFSHYKKVSRYHLLHDYDLTSIREEPEFQALLEKYDLKEYEAGHSVEPQTRNIDMGLGTYMSIDEIPFTKKGGVYEVKCSINELPLSFIFDTGASSVSISALEANFMMKNGYLSSKDVVGSQRFIDANGDISEGTIIVLKSVKFGNSELTNVRASVVHNQKAPLLLGQTVLNLLGKIEIDYKASQLKITK